MHFPRKAGIFHFLQLGKTICSVISILRNQEYPFRFRITHSLLARDVQSSEGHYCYRPCIDVGDPKSFIEDRRLYAFCVHWNREVVQQQEGVAPNVCI